jgi:hypothetical protein
MKTKIVMLILVLALSLVVTGLALANGGVGRTREVLGGGATDSDAGDVSLRATLGQGFWYAGAAAEYTVFLPLVIRH